MARKTIRIEIPTQDPTALIDLCQAVVKRQKKPGTTSPLPEDAVNMAAYESKTNEAATLQSAIEELDRELQEKTGRRDELLGMANGQNSQTKGTLLFETLQVRDILLGVNRGNENSLEPWGFGVVVGQAKSPTKKKPE